jgi:hypothetical protein
MTSKLDLKAISDYSNAFSEKLCNDFFSKNEFISGEGILNLSSIDQVNTFTIKGLYENWKATNEKFTSPYFDFSSEKVKAALKDFMNIVSQNIAVKKADLQPLLSKATAETLALTLNPIEYFDGVLRDLPDFKCTKADLAIIKKYNRINANLVNNLIEKADNKDFIFTNQALNFLDEAINETKLDDKDQIINQFAQILNCNQFQFYKNKTQENIEAINESSSSFFDQLPNNEALKSSEIETSIGETKIVENHIQTSQEKPEPATLNDTYQTNEPTLNDHLTQTDAKSLVDIHKNAPVKNLAASISLNQKFVFINKLFNGDSAAFNETLEILEQCTDTEEAINLLKYKYAPKYQWNLNSDEADELLDILKRKA